MSTWEGADTLGSRGGTTGERILNLKRPVEANKNNTAGNMAALEPVRRCLCATENNHAPVPMHHRPIPLLMSPAHFRLEVHTDGTGLSWELKALHMAWHTGPITSQPKVALIRVQTKQIRNGRNDFAEFTHDTHKSRCTIGPNTTQTKSGNGRNDCAEFTHNTHWHKSRCKHAL